MADEMSQLLQERRPGEFTSPLGKDVLALTRFDGSEAVSELFEFRVEALSSEENLDFDKALGHNCCVTFKTTSGADRQFNGVLVEAQKVGVANDLHVYRAILRPWLWLLSRTSDCRIWHKMSAVKIIKEVFDDRGFTDLEDLTSSNYPEIEYCVQYRETDLDFVCRLMENYGIYYFFKHSESKHTLVLADAKSSHHPVPDHATTPFFGGAQASRDTEHFNGWTSERRFRSGKYDLNDYDFKKPTKNLDVNKSAASKYNRGKMEIYDYPGLYLERSDGEKLAKVRLDADQAHDRRRYATGNSISLFPGGLTTLERHPTSAENIEYLVLRATHAYVLQTYRSGAAGADDYSGTYELLDASIPYRAPLVTPKALIYGPQTARVVAEDGNDDKEIDVDKYGRILVLFHWDRKKKQSCRVRVAQVWAGKQWGGQFIPRIGMEVVVEFLEGDPDRPLVVGAVYNDDNKPPYDLADNKTQSGFKSDSSLGHSGYNEFMFDDKSGEELIRMHAQKDHKVTILNTETTDIGEEFTGGKAESRTTTLKQGSDKLTVQAGDQTISITGDQTVNVMQNIAITANQSITITCGSSKITMTPTGITIVSGTIAMTAPKIDWN